MSWGLFWKQSIMISHKGRYNSLASSRGYSETKMVIGLGNYTMPKTRHSVGMSAVNYIQKQQETSWKCDRECKSDVAKVTNAEGQEFILLKPRQFMNINGKSVVRAVQKFQIKPENILLVHDDLDRPLGKFSLKQGGSASGHNGVKSVQRYLKTDQIPRLRVGIGRPISRADVTLYVLSSFTKEEEAVLAKIMEDCCKLIFSFIDKKEDR